MKNYIKVGRYQKAFTLVEVIVVIAIIAILTSIAYASLSQIRAKSRDQKRVATVHEIQLALEFYFNKNAKYPIMLWPADINSEIQKANSLYGYLTEKPQDPSIGDTYHYVPLSPSPTIESRCRSYHLWTKLELKSAALESKKGYSSLGDTLCGSVGDKKDASSDYLIYDLRP